MIINFDIIRKNLIWYLLVLFSWMPCFAYTIGYTKGVTLGIYGTIVFLTLFYVIQIFKKMKLTIALFNYLILIVFFISFIFIKSGYIIEDGVRDSIYLILIFLSFSLTYDIKLTQQQIHSLYNIPFFLSIVMSIFAIFPSSYDLNNYKNALYLNFQNPNILSFVLLEMIIFNLLGYIDEKRKRYLLGMGNSIILLILTHSRSSLLGVLVIFMFCYWYKFRPKVSSWIAVIVTFLPIIIIFLTLALGGINFSIFGKNGSSGRDIIWTYVLEHIFANKKFIFFGNGLYVNDFGNSMFRNSHNAYLQLLCDFGLIIFLIIMICILILNILTSKIVSNKYGYIAFSSVIGIILNNSFETHIADGIIGMTLMWIIIYWLIISKGGKNDNNSTCFKTQSVVDKL